MYAVKAFDIEVDLNQCTKLYDYGRGVYIARPEEGWDHQAIADGHRQAVAANEEADGMIKRMDSIHGEKGFLEKNEDKEKGLKFDSFQDDARASLPMRMLPVFNPGDVISGWLVLEAVKAIEAEEVKIKFKGMASTNLVYYNGKSSYELRGREVYTKEVAVVWYKAGTPHMGEGAGKSCKVQSGDNISPGKHTFPFSFMVPLDGQQSVPELVKGWSGDWAHIVYYIKATIGKGKKLRRGNIVTNKGLWVEKPYDIAQNPEYLSPMVQEKTLETGVLTKGKITCHVTLPAHAYIRGRQHEIPLKLEIDNQSGGPIDSVKACVILHGNYRGSSSKWHGSKSIKFKGARVHAGAIASGMCPQFSLQLPLSFEEGGLDGNLIPTGTLGDCEIIDVRYEVQVLLKRKGLHRNMELHIPIQVGTENSKDSLN